MDIAVIRRSDMQFRMDSPDWTLLRSFLAVAEGGSLSAAARGLGLTQPTLGRHIAELEAGLGSALFTRVARGLQPTEAALALLPAARRRLQLSRAKHRSLAGHSRMAKRLARWVPGYAYDEAQFFEADGAPDDVGAQRRGELGLGGQGALLAPVEVGGEQGAPPESEVEGRGSALDDEPGDEDGGRVGLEALALAGEELWVGRVGEEVEAEGLAQEGLGEAPVAVFEGARAS